MKRNFVLGSLLVFFALSCEKQNINQDLLKEETVESTLTPFLTLSFDSPPAMKDLIAIGKTKLSTSKDLPNTTPQYPDANYEKLVILLVKTADYTNAGTDKASYCRFIGRFVDNNGLYYSWAYILDNTNRDDLNRDSYNAFYYFYNVPYSSDKFYSGRLSNTSTDGWLCAYVDFEDVSCSGSRETRLSWGDPTKDWVQSDGNILSPEKFSSITSWLYYANCGN